MTVCVNSFISGKLLQRSTENARWCCRFTLSIWYYYCMTVISSGGFVRHYSHLLHKTSDWFVIHCRCDNIYNQAESFFIYTCTQRLFLLFLGSAVSWKENLLPRSGLVLCLFARMRFVMDVGHVLMLHHSRLSAPQLWLVSLGCGSGSCWRWPQADRERSGVRTEMGKPAGFFSLMSADPCSDWVDLVAVTQKKTLNTTATFWIFKLCPWCSATRLWKLIQNLLNWKGT